MTPVTPASTLDPAAEAAREVRRLEAELSSADALLASADAGLEALSAAAFATLDARCAMESERCIIAERLVVARVFRDFVAQNSQGTA